jgi:carbonic anhydrase
VTHQEHAHDRRWFVKVLAASSGAVALGTLAPIERLFAAAAAETDVLLLSCMDFRLTDATGLWMASQGLKGKYDHIVLAGAALGAVTPNYPEWNKTFWDHVGLAVSLHKIKKVIILDHRDCGAYQAVFGVDFAKDPARERTVHAEQLEALARQIKAKYPALEVEMALMALDGTVEKVT